ncbi:MAG: alpha/beta hydrolase [Burkholderiales bacterium]|nr:alpha/beta hydrolase [Burkholderiales bacterium]
MGGDASKGWRDLDAAARAREYSPSSCIGGNYQPFIAAYAARSAAVRARLAVPAGPGSAAARLDLAYGARTTQRLDLFLPDRTVASGSRPPLLVFIHGGYWQELSKDESAFAAADALRQGMAFAALDYTLAPAATVVEMVAECRQALRWLHAHADELGFDGARIVVAGSSAGAHLAAMCALRHGGGAGGEGVLDGVAKCVVGGVVLVSGIYELEPLVGTPINDALGLDAAAARAASPALADLGGFAPAIVCWGGIETAEFKRQGREFAALLQRAGTACRTFEVPGRNHFDVILDLADPATMLGAAAVELVRSS